MSVPINIPKLGVSRTEGTIIEWLVADGDQVQEGDALFLIETWHVRYPDRKLPLRFNKESGS